MTEPDRKRLRWSPPESPRPKRPIRDSIVFYAALAVLIVLIAWATGGPILPDGDREGLFRRAGAILIAAIFFAVATGWTVYYWRRRARTAAESDAR